MSSETPTADPEGRGDGALQRSTPLRRTLEGEPGQEYVLYLPASADADAPLVVLVHDDGRDAMAQVEAFAAEAEARAAILVAPRFDADAYPSYQRLGRHHQSESETRFVDDVLDEIVNEVAAIAGVDVPRVHIFGYAAGGRFALRYAMAHPDRVMSAATAAAEAYTFPDPDRRFPRGIGASRASRDLEFDPDRFLRVPMTVIEGALERSPEAVPLRRVGATANATRQRAGQRWVEAMRIAAERSRLTSQVRYFELQTPTRSFRSCVEEEALPRVAMTSLLGDDDSLAAGPETAAPDDAGEESDAARRLLIRRRLLIGVGIAALIAFLVPVLMWVHYRATHIVSRDAVVRGHIADVGTRLDGVLESVVVDAGDRVEAGQIVARLDDTRLQARMRQARSQLEKAERELEVEHLAIANERLRLAGTVTEVAADASAADADLRAARSVAQEALRRLELQRSLAKQGLVAEERVRVAETEHRTAKARVAAALAEQRAARAAEGLAQTESEGLAVRERRISVLDAEIAALRAELAAAEADLEGTVIRAPDRGAVVRRIVEPGGATVTGQPILSIWIGGEIWVEAWVDEDALGDLAVGGEATVSFPSYPDLEFRGVVERIGVSTDFELPDSEVPQPRNERMRSAPVIGVRIRLDDTDRELFPGLSAVVGIRKRTD